MLPFDREQLDIVPLIYLFIMSETCPRACSLHWDAANNFIRTVNSISHPYMYVSSSPSLSLSVAVAVAVASCRFFMESSQNRVVDYLNEGTTQEGVPHTRTHPYLFLYMSISQFRHSYLYLYLYLWIWKWRVAWNVVAFCFMLTCFLFLVFRILYFEWGVRIAH